MRSFVRALAGSAVALTVACGPEPKLEGAAGPDGTCVLSGCHAQVEHIHYGGPRLSCVGCHLGDATSRTKQGAHVTVDVSFNPTTPGSRFLDQPSMTELRELDPKIVRFLNPADYRVARQSCGQSALGGANCHLDIVEASLLLNRATLAGTMAGGGFLAGAQGKAPRYGVVAAVDELLPDTLPPETVAELQRLPDEAPPGLEGAARAFFPVYEQLCVECHVYRDGPRIPGRYYSSGCNACHMVTNDDARAGTGDATQDRGELGHVSSHRFTNLIPDKQCAHCHISHLGRSLLAQGVRERSEPEGDAAIGGPNRGVEDPEHHEPWSQDNYVKHNGLHEIYGKPYPYFVADEDGRNDVDETPPDVHTAAGMGCIDCHNIREAHGKSQMAARMDRELDVRCQSCHGRPGEVASLQSDAGLPFNQASTSVANTGTNQDVFVTADDGAVMQRVRFTGALHPVTQITRRTDPSSPLFNPRTRMGCALHAGTASERLAVKLAVNQIASIDAGAVADAFPGLPPGFTFEIPAAETDGRTECFACHNAWTTNCYGCHMVRDDRQSYTSKLSGLVKQGAVTTFGMSVVADSLAMGFNARGRITPMIGTSIFFTHYDASGKALIDAQPLVTGDGFAGAGNVHNPVHHHTVRQRPRDCDGCHPSATGSHDKLALMTALGLGSGRYTFKDGSGKLHLLDQQVAADYDGDGKPDDPVSRGLPAGPLFGVEPLVATTHVSLVSGAPPPGPLDRQAINLLLGSLVVPQRPSERTKP